MRFVLAFALAYLSLSAGAAQDAKAFERPADTPAISSRLAARSPLMAVATAGQRVVAVGLRGHVVYSDDLGKSWVQAHVPVSSDLVAVTFVGEREGWAVGHGGVVIHSRDGGANWEKQVDGDHLSRLAVAHYESLAGAGSDAKVSPALKRAKAVARDDSTNALLDVIFVNDKVGFVVGAFNRIFRTRTAERGGCPGWSGRATTTSCTSIPCAPTAAGSCSPASRAWSGTRRRDRRGRGEADALQGDPIRFAGVRLGHPGVRHARQPVPQRR